MSDNHLTNIIKNGVLICTDLETDDCLAIELILKTIVKDILKSYEESDGELPDSPCSLLIVTGEGDVDKTGLAGAIVASILDPLLYMHFDGHSHLLNSYIRVRIVQGSLSNKEYPKEALIAYGTPVTCYAVDADAPQTISEFLALHAVPIIALKPMRDLIECAKSGFSFEKHTLYAYGSFNIRSLSDPTIGHFLHSFKEVVLYESFHAIGSQNSINIESYPEVFSVMSDGSLKLCNIWNTHSGAACAKNIEWFGKEIRKQDGNSQKILKILTRLGRSIKVLKSIAESNNQQMVLADHGLVGCMISPTLYNTKRGRIEFDDNGYTNIREDPEGKVCLITNVDKDRLVTTICEVLAYRI